MKLLLEVLPDSLAIAVSPSSMVGRAARRHSAMPIACVADCS